MDWTTIITCVATCVSALVGITSIVIAVCTLRQNQKMIEGSTRPYITIYSDCTYFQDVLYYIIIKNFGISGAIITKFEADKDLSAFVSEGMPRPFEHIENTFIAPGQSFKASFHLSRSNMSNIKFHIEYKSDARLYTEDVTLNMAASGDSAIMRASTTNKELKIISYALQDLCEKHM